tara:strand:+ start:209 stop:340 length:132 start_codon:yes stop_codon:yes gene_type:complete
MYNVDDLMSEIQDLQQESYKQQEQLAMLTEIVKELLQRVKEQS